MTKYSGVFRNDKLSYIMRCLCSLNMGEGMTNGKPLGNHTIELVAFIRHAESDSYDSMGVGTF